MTGAGAPRAEISACIVCRNEADRLAPCLESLAWVDEVVVLDLASEDGSAALARSLGARVIPHETVPIVELVRNVVAQHAAHDWILVVDPDERVTPGLARRLRAAVDLPATDAVVLPRMNRDLGFEPSHPSQRYEPQLRLYRRDRVSWPETPNALPEVPLQRVHRIEPLDELVLVHDRSRTIAEVLDRSVRYAPLQAASMLDAGQAFSAAAMTAALWKETRTKLIEPRAWVDGVPGLLRAGILIGFKFYVWAELWRQAEIGRTDADDRFVRILGVPLEGVRLASHTAGRARAGVRRRRRRAPDTGR